MKLTKQFRAIGVELVRAAEGESPETLEFSFSSEEPVDRWFGMEILSHEKSAADFSRMNDGANVLWNHDTDVVIGVVEKAWIGKDKRGHLKMRWGTSPKAQEIRKDVDAGVIRNVSFGYQIQEMELTKSGDDGREYTATKWMAFEASFVSVPADQTVGVGRAKGDEEFEVRVINKRAGGPGEKRAMETEQEKKERLAREAAEKAQRDADIKQAGADAVKAERERASAIEALGEKHDMRDLARELVNGGKSVDEARAAILERMGKVQKPLSGSEALVGLTDKEQRQFSYTRLLHALANPHDRAAQDAAGFELAASKAALELRGARPLGSGKGVGARIPVDVLRQGNPFVSQKRDLVVGTASAGGNLVATDLLAGSFIELLRNKAVVFRLGAQSLNGLVGNIAIPKQTGAGTAYWVSEGNAPTESALAVGQVAMSPKTLGAFTDISRKLLIQSSIDVENMVKNDLARIIALAIDSKSLYGDGTSNTPTGLRSTTGLNTVDFANSDPTFAEIVDLETQVAADNADIGTLAYAVNAQGRGKLKTTLVTATYGDRMIWEPGGTVNGYRTEVSNQISKLSTADYDYWFGNWNDLILGFWSGLDVLVDPYTASTTGTVRVVALQDCDVGVRHGESFSYGNKTIA